MIHLPRSSYSLRPWKNGLGTTEEIYVHPPGEAEFIFRISMAALSTSGSFSLFPGVDRNLILLEGPSIKLNDRIVPHLSPVSFPGEEEIAAKIEAPGRDLNLMCRRGKATGTIEVVSEHTSFAGDSDFCLIFALTAVTIGSLKLDRYDSCLLQKPDKKVEVSGEKFLRLPITLS